MIERAGSKVSHIMKGKKRSAKSADFPRKKRKLGKGKRPAENSTNVSFKSRSIVIPSQLEQSQQPTGKRKLPLESLLRHLNHFKPSMRSDGLAGLRELFQDHPHTLTPNLAKLMESVLGRIIDGDASVRHSLYTFLSFLFSTVPSNHIRTHFSSVVVHVSCGLTHISDRIQFDSLKIFRLLMNHYPTLLPPHAQHLLPLIVGLVSRHSCAVVSHKATKGKARASLAHDPHSKLSKWSSRIDVFGLLSRFLETLYECVRSSRKRSSIRSSNPEYPPLVVDVQNQRVVVEQDGDLLPAHSTLCNFSSSIPHVMPLQRQGLPHQLAVSGATHSSPSSRSSSIHVNTDSIFPDVSKFVEFSESLIALLLECWVECAPVQGHVPKNTLTLMETIISLLCLILKLAVHIHTRDFAAKSTDHTQFTDQGGETPITAINVLTEKYASAFMKHFMTHFPLHCTVTSTNFVQYVKMNLILCQITTLLSQCELPSLLKALQSVCTFYGTLGHLVDPSISSQSALECSGIISDTLSDLLVAVDRHGLPGADLRCVVNGLSTFYDGCHPQSSAKRTLIQCFRDLLATRGTSSRVFSEFLLSWLESLPQLLVDLGQVNPSLSAFIIDSLASSASHIPHTQLQDHLLSITGPVSIISQLPSATQRRFVELLWLVPTLKPELLSRIREWVCSSGCTDTAVAAYLVEVVHHKFLRRKDHESVVDWTSQYLVFMLGLVLGGDKPEQKDESMRTPSQTTVERGSNVQHRMKIVEVVCDCLKSTHFANQVLELASPTLIATLEDVQSLPSHTALAILHFIQRLKHCQSLSSSCGSISSTLIPSLARLCFSVLTGRENSVPHSTAVDASVSAVHELLKVSQELLVFVLKIFAAEITNAAEGNDVCRRTTLLLIFLLDSADLNSALRKCSSAVHTTVGALAVKDEDLSRRIKVSVMKFPVEMSQL